MGEAKKRKNEIEILKANGPKQKVKEQVVKTNNLKNLKNTHSRDEYFESDVKIEICTMVKYLTKSEAMVYAKNTIKYARDIMDVAVHACALNWWGWVLYKDGKEDEYKAFFDAYNYISREVYTNASEDCACDYHSYLH